MWLLKTGRTWREGEGCLPLPMVTLGLRYSDVFNLRRCDVHEDHIDVTTVKTNDTLRIELNEESKGILERYANMTFENDKALPVISNQKMNDSLHELCRLAGDQ